MTQIPSVTVAAEGPAGAELLVVGCFQDGPPEVDRLPEAVRRAVQQVAARPGWHGREEQCGQTSTTSTLSTAAPTAQTLQDSPQTAQLPQIAPSPATPPVVSLYGLGMPQEFTFGKLERWLLRVAEDARQSGFQRLAIALPRHEQTVGAAAARRVTRVAALCDYRFEHFRTDIDNGSLKTVELLPPAGSEADYGDQLGAAVKVAAAVGYARDLANMPGNAAHPDWMEEQARELAASHGMEITVLDAAELGRRRMGGLLAVGGGSAHPPRLLRLSLGEHPAAAGAARAPSPAIALVGKGVTFDTGGISIKPAADMEQMKFDKCGACAVLGAMRAAADLGLGLPLRAYLPVAENMLGGAAYRPGDIVRCYNGKTVEITNTDAEGRMILADALSWAAEEGAGSLVELSTLTGSCVVALGHLAAGLFSQDDGLAAELAVAAAASGERLWRLPMLPEFLDEMKTLHADLRNSAGRWGGASTAAAFLSQFTGSLRRWAHLDIAGVAYATSEDGRGTAATGFGVASLVDWLRRREP
jgi:leucyl aminopeptidase